MSCVGVRLSSFVLLLLICAAAPAAAQTPTHRFFDRLNLATTIGESAALVADGITTQRALRRFPDGREGEPLARFFVDRGWRGQIAGGALVVSADVGIRYLLHRKGHHRIERWLPAILTTYGVAGAVHNARLLSRDR